VNNDPHRVAPLWKRNVSVPRLPLDVEMLQLFNRVTGLAGASTEQQGFDQAVFVVLFGIWDWFTPCRPFFVPGFEILPQERFYVLTAHVFEAVRSVRGNTLIWVIEVPNRDLSEFRLRADTGKLREECVGAAGLGHSKVFFNQLPTEGRVRPKKIGEEEKFMILISFIWVMQIDRFHGG